MEADDREKAPKVYWFVGASFSGTEDQSERFVREGIWENGYTDKYLEEVRAVAPGDPIAIKSTYTKKHDLPFDNQGQFISVMAIKATGVVRENVGDGRRLRVDWSPVDPPRLWYFYTLWGTIKHVLPGDPKSDALISFVFHGQPQNIDDFRKVPSLRARLAKPQDSKLFRWTPFYEAVADALLAHQYNRQPLIEFMHGLAERVNGVTPLQDKLPGGTTAPLKDICPFTTMGIFNRGVADTSRKVIAGELATFLGVEEPVPETFESIPILNNQNSWFFGSSNAAKRKADDIDALWRVFAAALRFAGTDDLDARSHFVESYDDAITRYGVKWNLSSGLYWIRPWRFLTLDSQSREYLKKKLDLPIPATGPKGQCTAEEYLALLAKLEKRFDEENYPVHSYPELSLAAWKYDDAIPVVPTRDPQSDEDEPGDLELPVIAAQPYTVDDIMADGCFLDQTEVERMRQRLLSKKNLILQGPPGTGKTWLAKRLAFTVAGVRDSKRVRALQFHANLSYEDFVRGWRPAGDGKLVLTDGPFLQMIHTAQQDVSNAYVLVIEEINRGNPAQIFGELLTLLEADKRTPSEALEFCYRTFEAERVHIPDNLYVIGTMNVADRSLALVDFALRRRFAFIDLEPALGSSWRKWMIERFEFPDTILSQIEQRISHLNKEIANDSRLGRQFCIGHSYVTPAPGSKIGDPNGWFRDVVRTEIAPLLEEYWFDAGEKAGQVQAQLIEGF